MQLYNLLRACTSYLETNEQMDWEEKKKKSTDLLGIYTVRDDHSIWSGHVKQTWKYINLEL